MFAPAVKLEPDAGEAMLTVGDWLAPAHLVPLMEKLVGAVLVPVNVPLKPISMAWLAVSVRFQSRLVAVTVVLPVACDQVALQPGGVSRWLPGYAKDSVQPLSVSPRLVTWKL